MTPTTEPARRIATLFHRKASTPWSEKELKVYKQLYLQGAFSNRHDLTLLELYYGAERKKKEGGIHRRDLYTFLNNFAGELDRATAYGALQHRLNRAKIDEQRKRERSRLGGGTSEEEWQRIGALAKAELARFKQSMSHG
jgi:hypothetical protein